MDDQPVKPGYKTTEFWLSALATVVGILLGSGVIPETGATMQIIGFIAAALSALGYTVSRAIVKK